VSWVFVWGCSLLLLPFCGLRVSNLFLFLCRFVLFCLHFSGLVLFSFSLFCRQIAIHFCRQIAIHVEVLVFLYHCILRARGRRGFQTVLLRLPALHYVGGAAGGNGNYTFVGGLFVGS